MTYHFKIDAERLLRHVVDVVGMGELFLEAALTESKLPGVIASRYKVAWPDFRDDPGMAYGYNEMEVGLSPANAAEIWRYGAALDLARCLDKEDCGIVWACAHSAIRRRRGIAWKRVGAVSAMHPSTGKRAFSRSMLQMYYHLLTMRADRRDHFGAR